MDVCKDEWKGVCWRGWRVCGKMSVWIYGETGGGFGGEMIGMVYSEIVKGE